MKPTILVRRMAACLAAAGMCVPQLVFAQATPAESPAAVVDVRLSADGVLHGRVVDGQDAAQAKIPVSLASARGVLAVAKTDQHGSFRFAGLCDGVYWLSTGQGARAFRLWNARTAPPTAEPYARIVTGTVRGQCGMRALRDCLANPLIIAGIIATSVAVPVAIHNSKSPSSP